MFVNSCKNMEMITTPESTLKLMRNIGLISNLIVNKDIIKLSPEEGFKSRLFEYLDESIKALKDITQYYDIEYIEVDDVDTNIDIQLCLNRLYYFVSEIISLLVLKDSTGMKSIKKTIAGIVYYIKVICSIYDININKIIIDKDEYESIS